MALNLTTIAARLSSLEESIIFKLLDRAQFKVNAQAYLPGKSGFQPQETLSLFELRLLHQESMDAIFGRYNMPEERPFFNDLPPAKRQTPPIHPELNIKDLETINVSGKIRIAYLDLLHQLCQAGDDGHYGSSVEHDVICLQALARRIHYGALFVAESKYQENPEKYQALVQRRDEGEITAALTRKEVEDKILLRVANKVETIQAACDPGLRVLIEPKIIVDFFKDWIIPLTKEGEVDYLLQRPMN